VVDARHALLLQGDGLLELGLVLGVELLQVLQETEKRSLKKQIYKAL
jgi:hypothetical protein